MAHYLFNLVNSETTEEPALHDRAAGYLAAGLWGIDTAERHGDALAPGDLVLIYLGEPERVFVGRAELASAVHDWTPTE